MASRTPYPEAARNLLRETLFYAARHHLETRPWSEVTMGDIAATAGVSRQTLYKEFGSKSEFAVNLTIHEGERFLGAVEDAVRAHTDNPRDAIRAALELFLRTAGEDPLLRMVVTDDGSGWMLPFVTTQGMPVTVWATARLSAVIEEGWPQAPKADVNLLAEALVRLAISYITNPTGTPDKTADSVAKLLGPFIDRALGTA
ncbi:MAG: TetR family transcriptional regulator [Actinobacteria bacterium]|nr:TetR family transcriptional regulator [Actinomycetota bacterium]